MARAQMTARTTTAPVHRGGMGGWIVAGIVALLLAIGAYIVLAGGGTRYNAPSYTSAPATAAPATAAPAATGAPAPQVTSAPAPQVTSAPAPRYP